MKKLDMMRAIKERGFMAKDIADKLGITTVAMSLRTNAKNPRLDTMVQIAEVIGCDITDLFYPDPAEEAAEKAEKERKAMEMVESIQKRLTGYTGKKVCALDDEQATTHRTTFCSYNRSRLADYYRHFSYNNDSPLALPAVEWQGEGECIEKLMKDLEAEKENGQENAPQEGIQQENIQPESTQTTIQTSTFCPHCGKKVRVGVVLLPEE